MRKSLTILRVTGERYCVVSFQEIVKSNIATYMYFDGNVC